MPQDSYNRRKTRYHTLETLHYPPTNKTGKLDILRRSSMIEIAPTLSNPLLCIRLHPSGSFPLPEGDEPRFKMEERQLNDTAVSKSKTSITRCSPSPQAVPTLPKAENVGLIQAARSVPCGNKSKPAGFTQVIPSVPCGTRPMVAVSNGDKPKPASFTQAPSLSRRRVDPIVPADVKGEHTETAREQPTRCPNLHLQFSHCFAPRLLFPRRPSLLTQDLSGTNPRLMKGIDDWLS
jgi:hypothetical protein